MRPLPGSTVISPSLKVHFAGVPSRPVQLSRLFPSKRTMASEGASVGFSAGVMILGWGSQISDDSGVFLSWAKLLTTRSANPETVRNDLIGLIMVVLFKS